MHKGKQTASNVRLQLGTSILIQQIIHTLAHTPPSRQRFTTGKTLTQLSSLNHAEHGTIHSTAMLFHKITRKPKARQVQKNRTAAEIRLIRKILRNQVEIEKTEEVVASAFSRSGEEQSPRKEPTITE